MPVTSLTVLLLLAQAPYRLADLNTFPQDDGDPNPRMLTVAGPLAFFYASDPAHNTELWRTDGTDAGTFMVRDLVPNGPADVTPLVVLDAGLVLKSQGQDLYVSDGTARGTVLVCCRTLYREHTAVLGGAVLLGAYDDANVRRLYRLDGSPEGASLVFDVRVDDFLGVVGGRALFAGRDNVTSVSGLWATDGTAAGTQQLFAPVTAFTTGVSRATYLNGLAYLWVSPGSGRIMLVTDGTPSGTQSLGAWPGTFASAPFGAGNYVFFNGTRSAGAELYASQGVAAQYPLIADILPGTVSSAPSGFAPFQTGLLFAANDGVTGSEPWFVDGFDAGVYRVADLTPGGGSSLPSSFAANGARAAFGLSGTQALGITDGTPAGTQRLPVTFSSGGVSQVTAFGSGWLFSGESDVNGQSAPNPWFTDGTAAGTRMVSRLSARGNESSSPFGFMALGNKVPFMATLTVEGTELVALDVLDGGIAVTGDFNPVYYGREYPIGVARGQVFYWSANAISGYELFSSRGNPADAVLVRDINPGPGSADPFVVSLSGLTVGDTLYFAAYTPGEGEELWRTDGTAAGTQLVNDLDPGSFDGLPELLTPLGDGGIVLRGRDFLGTSVFRLEGDGGMTRLWGNYVEELAQAGGLVFADLCTMANGCELYATDGTVAGSRLYADLFDGGSSNPDYLVPLGDRLFFIAEKEDDTTSLWVATPADGGVQRVHTIATASTLPYLTYLVAGANGVFFVPRLPATGREPWFSDGTAGRLVRDIIPGPEGSEPDEFVAAGGRTYFVASDVEHGRELWVSDGTESGTRMVADLVPGPGSSSPGWLFAAHGWLFFQARDALGDTEPHALPLTEAPPAIVSQLTGQTGGDGGWFVSDVGVTFRVGDPVVPILSSSGCGTTRTDVDGGFIGSTIVTQDGPDTVLPCTATSSGGTSSVTVSVRRDATAPRITCPAAVVAPATGVSGAAVSFATPVAVDQIDPAPAVTLSQASGSTFPLGRTVVTATATDHVGHVSECTFTVEVRDPTAPVLTCPMDQQVAFGAAVTYQATATDDLDPAPMLTYSAPSGTVFPPGRSGVSVTAIDAAGNLASCAFFVTVEAPADAGRGGMVNGSCGCGSAPFGALVFAVLALLRRRRR